MKITGIILLVIGVITTLGAIVGTLAGHSPGFSGLWLIILGIYLISRARKKKEEKEKMINLNKDN